MSGINFVSNIIKFSAIVLYYVELNLSKFCNGSIFANQFYFSLLATIIPALIAKPSSHVSKTGSNTTMEFNYAATCILSGKEDRGVWRLSTTKPSEAYYIGQ